MTAAQTLADVAAAYLINAQARGDLQDSSDQSREAALHDPLTGLPNRVLMLELLEHAFRAAGVRARPRRCSSSISTGSRRSTTPTGIRSAMSCWWRWPSG